MSERRVSRRRCAWRGSGAWEGQNGAGKQVAPVHHGIGAANMRNGHGMRGEDSSGKSKAACYVVCVRQDGYVTQLFTVKGNRDFVDSKIFILIFGRRERKSGKVGDC